MRLINDVDRNFTMVPNYILKRKDVSLKAIGLYSKLLAFPNNWNFTESGLVSVIKDGKDSLKSALQELEDLGLFFKFQSRNINGTLGEIIFYISPVPMTEEMKQEIIGRFNPIEIVKTSETLEITASQPSAGNPLAEKPLAGNPIQYNINKYNINEYNIEKEKINKKEKNVSKINEYENEFEDLWKLYPRKEGKNVALKKYIQYRKNNEATFDEVKQGILNYKKIIEKNKTSTQYILHGSTFFNQKRWEDEDLKDKSNNSVVEAISQAIEQISKEKQDVMNRLLE